jgi:beta-galactosidase
MRLSTAGKKGKNDDDYPVYFKDWWRRDLEAMVLRDRNHPSIILWSIGNEINERAEPHGVEIGKALAQWAHELDPTRKVTAAICQPWDQPKGTTWQSLQPAFTYLDVGGYNYESGEYEKDPVKFPDRVIVGTESVPAQILPNWNRVEENSWVIGDFIWTAMDYLGESGLGHTSIAKSPTDLFTTAPYPWFNAFCGDIDLIGNKKPQSYFHDVVWRRSPLEMAVQRPVPTDQSEETSAWGWSDELRSWTWPGFEDKPLAVQIYTRGTRVKLILNGKEVAAKELTEKDHLRAEFKVNYAPGTLKAVAFDGDKEIGSLTFDTAGEPDRIVLLVDRRELKASRDDLSYLMVQVVDKAGRIVSCPMQYFQFPSRSAVQGNSRRSATQIPKLCPASGRRFTTPTMAPASRSFAPRAKPV